MNRMMTILFVVDGKAMAEFYRQVLQVEPHIDEPGMRAFRVGGAELGLMPRSGIRRLLPTLPEFSENPAPSCELYLIVKDPEPMLARALEAGALLVSPGETRSWGEWAAYCRDPEGHLLAIAAPAEASP